MIIRAKKITCEKCDDAFLSYVFVRGNDDSGRHYLSLARSRAPGDTDEVAVEVDDQSRATRSGIMSCDLCRDCLILRLCEASAAKLGLEDDPRVRVELSGDPDILDELGKTLAVVFAGHGVYRDISYQNEEESHSR